MLRRFRCVQIFIKNTVTTTYLVLIVIKLAVSSSRNYATDSNSVKATHLSERIKYESGIFYPLTWLGLTCQARQPTAPHDINRKGLIRKNTNVLTVFKH